MSVYSILPDDHDEVVKLKIGETYRQLEYGSGWTFMMCRRDCLSEARVMLVGLNPGGRADFKDYREFWDCPEGNSYWESDWDLKGKGQAPLQQQVQRLMSSINTAPSEIFAAQFVPFRSQNWNSLPRKDEAIGFSRSLWKWVLAQNKSASLIFSLGHQASNEMAHLLEIKQQPEWLGCGWGKQVIGRYQGKNRTVISLPHLSRYKIFGREGRPAEKALSNLLAGIRKVNTGEL
jgi:hypothetical protein